MVGAFNLIKLRKQFQLFVHNKKISFFYITHNLKLDNLLHSISKLYIYKFNHIE